MEQEKRLKEWFSQMAAQFKGVRFRYEYSEKKGKILVSYYTSARLQSSDEFYRFVIAFEDDMVDTYGDNSPLFCENEELFKLTENAQSFAASPIEAYAQLKWDVADCDDYSNYIQSIQEYSLAA